MIDAWLIYNKQDYPGNESYVDWFREEAAQVGISLELVFKEQLTKRIATLPDLVINRTRDASIGSFFESKGCHVFNSSFITALANDKASTYRAMENLGVPLLKYGVYEVGNLPNHPDISFPFVCKRADGHGGTDVHLVTDQGDWLQMRRHLQGKYIIQEATVQHGKDVRVFVIGKEVIAAVLRENKEDFRANFKLGGTAQIYPLNEQEKELIQKIINNFQFGMVGIDFFIGKSGELIFNELEDVVGSRTLSATTNINILANYTQHIKKAISN